MNSNSAPETFISSYYIEDNDGKTNFICKICRELRRFATISRLKRHLCEVHNMTVLKAPPGPRPLINDPIKRKEHRLKVANDYYHKNRNEILKKKKLMIVNLRYALLLKSFLQKNWKNFIKNVMNIWKIW